jgi:hypothetical protein
MALAALLPITTSVLGGIQGYRQSGGDIGATLLGAGIGAAGGAYLPAGVRMAGSALAGTPLAGLVAKVAPEGYKASQALQAIKAGAGLKGAQAAATAAGMANPMAQQILGREAIGKALTGGAVLGGSLALPALAGGAANLVSAPVRALTGGAGQVGQQGLGMLASGQPYVSNYGANLPAAVPNVDQYGNVTPSGLPAEVLGLPGLGRTLEAQRQGRVTAENLQRYGDIDLAFREAVARKDFERQAAMKGIGQNIATQAAMIQNAQMGAQNLGQTFGQGISNNIGRIYQYQ